MNKEEGDIDGEELHYHPPLLSFAMDDGFSRRRKGRGSIPQELEKVIYGKMISVGSSVKNWFAAWVDWSKDIIGGYKKKETEMRSGAKLMRDLISYMLWFEHNIRSTASSEEIDSNVDKDKYWSLLYDIERRERLAKILRTDSETDELRSGSETDELSVAKIIYQTVHCSNILFLEAILAQINMHPERKGKPKLLWRHINPPHLQGMSKSNPLAAMLTEHEEKIKSNFNPIRRVSKRQNTAEPCVLNLHNDLSAFQATSKVPEQLQSWVSSSSKKTQADWYTKILKRWNEQKPHPKTGLEASRIVTKALKKHRKKDVQGLLCYYGLPSPPKGVKFEFETLPVDTNSVADGDTLTVYASVKDPLVAVPKLVKHLMVKRARFLAKSEYENAKELEEVIEFLGYRILSFQNDEGIVMKLVLRLAGIDAPESQMEYGPESGDELLKIVEGKCLKVLVYDRDQYGRWIADVYCMGELVQTTMLQRGMAWYYDVYDKREVFEKCEKEAKEKGIGLWASPNPEKPWEWRKKNKNRS